MSAQWKKVLSCILVPAMMLAVFPMPYAMATEPTEPGITLGSPTLSGSRFYYDNAFIYGMDIRTILISFSDNVEAGDAIILPSTPAGFTVSSSSAGNAYAKRVNLDAGIASSTVQDYIRSVGFTIASSIQTVQITVSTENVTQDTFYNADTGHYYQFVPDTTSTWIDAYNAAKAAAYMGRSGYLATITSLGEDTFANALSNGKTGWLGGTILTNTGESAGSLYYNGFTYNTVVSTGWYWACGPERGTTFYNIDTLYPNQNDTTFINQKDALNSTYYNWSRGSANEPNNNTAGFYLNSDYETCLSTLKISGRTGKHGTAFAWNDIRYNFAGSDSYHANGYLVEYGDQLFGDSGSASNTFATASGTLEAVYTATVNTNTDGAPAAAQGSVELKQGGTTVYTASSGATGVYNASAVNGTYDVYINNEDTGKDITISSGNGSVTVNYYTVSFAVSNTGASGSTISATAGGSSITSGTVVLAGKAITITAAGVGATSYTYLWSGAGTSSQTTAAITIASLSGAVNASCAVTGTTTYEANVYTATDGVWGPAPGAVELKQGGVTKYTAASNGTGRYTANAVNGTYDVFINNEDSKKDIAVNGASAGVTVLYYTVKFAVQDAGAASGSTISAITQGPTPIASGAAVLAGKGVQITASGAGADSYTYAWSGPGSNFETGPVFQFLTIPGPLDVVCTVTGTDAPTYSADIYTAVDGVYTTAPGIVELKQSGITKYTVPASGTPGLYTVQAVNGTYDIYVNNENTGLYIYINGTNAGVQVDYYTVSFSAQDAGIAWGSTVAATVGGTPITSGTAVLKGKAVRLTGHGAGGSMYVYAWSGPGINGETGQTITIYPSGTVNALCKVTGTAETRLTKIYTYIDGAPATVPGSVQLWRGGAVVFTATNTAAGVYSVWAAYGTFDVYINNEDTGVDFAFSSPADSTSVYYYTVSFAAANAGTASGSTISAAANGTSITSGTAVLPGKEIAITAQGAGADSYTYLWAGPGTSGETTADILIPALLGTVNALCTITGTTVPVTEAANVYTYKDGVPVAAPGDVELKQGGTAMYILSSGATGVYTALAAHGTYDIYINNEDTGVDLTVSDNSASATVSYYTVSFSVANQGTATGSTVSATTGGASITSGTAVLAGKAVTIIAAGAGADSYTYLWAGSGTSGETTPVIAIPELSGTVNAVCTVTGTATSFAPGTLEEEADDITVGAQGLFTQDARLYIIPIPDGEADREELEAMLSGKQTAAAFEVHIEPADAFKAPLTLTFQLGAQYNGRTVYILHKLNGGSVEQFSVTVSNGEAVITVQELSPFLLTVDPPVNITSQPQSVTIVTGQAATFSVTATGTAPLTYQWQKKTGPSAPWEDILGALNPEHTTSQANLSNTGFQYRVIVTDAYERSVTSDAATLTVIKASVPPATGDHAQPALYGILMILFLLAAALLLRKRKTA